MRGTDTERAFRACGLSHVLAVSGLHLGLCALLVTRTARALRLGMKSQALTCFAACAAFSVLTGMQVSTVRAMVMVVAAWAATIVGRRADPLSSLALAVIGILVLSPMAVFDVGLRLSASAVGGLLLFGRLASTWFAGDTQSMWGRVGAGIAATSVAQISTWPVAAGTFNVFSLIALVANPVVLPIASMSLSIGLVGAILSLVSRPIGKIALTAACACLQTARQIASTLAAVPASAVATPDPTPLELGIWAAVMLVLWIVWPIPAGGAARRKLLVLAVAVISMVAIGPAPRGVTALVLDVGQADAILVRDGRRSMLVDCGGPDGAVLEALGQAGVRRIDCLVLTHAHDDHLGGLSYMSGVIDIDRVVLPVTGDPDDFAGVRRMIEREFRASVYEVSTGDEWSIGRLDVRVAWPDGSLAERETNDTSVVLVVEGPGCELVLTGDAEIEALAGIHADGGLSDCDVLKLSHHGSENGLSTESLTAWAPSWAIASVGEGNSFGHPSPETLSMLEAAGVRLARTDLDGTVWIDMESGAVATGAATW